MDKPESFEQSMARLEEIVAVLEQGDLSLDESLRRYEEGIRVLRQCEAFLKNAEQKVKILLEDGEGKLREQPFEVARGQEPRAQADPNQDQDASEDEPAGEEDEEEGNSGDDDPDAKDDEIPF
jgi:exodeoxyribonuclease VII small subunit